MDLFANLCKKIKFFCAFIQKYTYAWEKDKFGNIYNFSISTNSLSRSQLNYDKGEIKNIHYGDILVNYSSILDVETDKIPFITDGTLDKYKPNLLKNGDVIFADAAEDDTVGKAVEVNGLSDENLVSGLHTIVARPKEKMADYFSGYYINSDTYHRQLLRLMQGTKVSSISKGNLQKTIISYTPNLDEQTKIGQLFQVLDNLLALHQRKYNKLKDLKNGYLQEMFPKGTEKIPEIRFRDFNGEWEERKLGDISDKVIEKNKENNFTETLTNSAEYGIINQREFFDKDISNEKNLNGYYIVRQDDFVYNPRISNFAPVGPIKRNKLGRTGVMSPLYYVFRTHNIYKRFLEYYFATIIWHKFMKLNGDSGARADRFAIKDSIFKEMQIPYPSLTEQKRIGAFFKQLEDTITQQESKLKHLKQLKQAYLQNMFV